ncbi:MAG: hypothetical protein QOI13_81 [Paraburkholderia sp.]|nr:hypothetical protein [Paraburkholderia sp.]
MVGQSLVGYELFTSKLHALWDDNGYFVELETPEKFGIAIPDLCDYIQMRDVAHLDIQRDKKRKHPTVEQAVKGDCVSQTTQKRMTAAEGLPRSLARVMSLLVRDYISLRDGPSLVCGSAPAHRH